jgi:histidinol-phosphate aminotransferase
MDTVAQKLTLVAFEDGAWFEQTRAAVMETREWITDELDRLGFQTLPSKANFIFTTHPNFCASKLYELLREQGILVRYFNKPRIDCFLRISIGTDEEMTALVKALKSILK